MNWFGAALSLCATLLAAAQNLFAEKKHAKARLQYGAVMIALTGFSFTMYQMMHLEEKRSETKIKLLGRLTELSTKNFSNNPLAAQEELSRLRRDIAESDGSNTDYVYVEVWKIKKELEILLTDLRQTLADKNNQDSLVSRLDKLTAALASNQSDLATTRDATLGLRDLVDTIKIDTIATRTAAEESRLADAGLRALLAQWHESAKTSRSATEQIQRDASETQRLLLSLKGAVDKCAATASRSTAKKEPSTSNKSMQDAAKKPLR